MRSTLLTITLLCCCLPGAFGAAAREISIPITLDYELLEALITQRSYTGADATAELINEGDGCLAVTLSDPDFSGGDGAVRFATDISLHVGTPIGNTCLMPYQWQGTIETAQTPRLDPATWELGFQTTDTRVLGADGRPLTQFDLIWDRIMPVVNRYLAGFTIALNPPVEDLKTMILPLFTTEAQAQAEMLLNSIRPGAITVDEEGIVATVRADAVEIPAAPEDEPFETLSEAEINAFMELWETWDSLLVYLISVLSEQPLSAAERQVLVDLLLDTRHEFVAKINDRNVQRDFVRDQFVHGWEQLSALFRKHLLHGAGQSQLGYLSFITATDALMILDELGPAFGIEVSRNGLVRLAKILGGEGVELNYAPGVNRSLQRLFETDPENDQDGSPQTVPATENSGSISVPRRTILDRIAGFMIAEAHGAELPSFAEIKRWQVPRDDLDTYLSRVRKLLDVSSTALVIRRQIPPDIGVMYHSLIPAIAWQESCFRQFVVKDRKLTYLLSYNKSSVGLMQVNERVWRGIYDTQRLRWDIRYNAEAGCEIADMYLQKYALRKAGEKILADDQTLAQLVYAMYNGGPSQYDKFLGRKKTGQLYESDQLFVEKYGWVKAQSWDNIDRCL